MLDITSTMVLDENSRPAMLDRKKWPDSPASRLSISRERAERQLLPSEFTAMSPHADITLHRYRSIRDVEDFRRRVCWGGWRA